MIKIAFTGDFAPLAVNNFNIIDDNLLQYFETINLHVTNLETPLTTNEIKIIKTGPSLKSNTNGVKVLKNAKVNIACLANNHSYDYGSKGMEETVNVCKGEGIHCIGTYLQTSNNNNRNYIYENGNTKILLLNYCDHEFSVRYDDKTNGAIGYNLIDIISEINYNRALVDFIVIIYHGGQEYSEYPSPYLQKELRYLIDIGADAVISHHSHVISGVECYKNKPIFYSLGNFYFPLPNENNDWYYGLIAELNFGNDIGYTYKFVRTNSLDMKLKLVQREEEMRLKEKIQLLTYKIINSNLLQDRWLEYKKYKSNDVITSLFINSLTERVLAKIGFKKYVLSKKKSHIIKTFNLIRCNAHRELIVEILSDYIK